MVWVKALCSTGLLTEYMALIAISLLHICLGKEREREDMEKSKMGLITYEYKLRKGVYICMK